jgi:MerR family transcriptional regulator/heat shock protein HspR
MATQDAGRSSGNSSSRALYAISVAAELAGTGQQNIRLYETKGLLTPSRTSGGTRQYSDDDIAVLLRIGELLEQGLTSPAWPRCWNLRRPTTNCTAP